LHVFDAGHEIQKYTWANTGVRLIEQVRKALESGLYPLFVAEGESHQKLDRIQHSSFLSRAYRSFANISGTLIVLGHSFADNDDHILELIRKGKVSTLLVGVHGDAEKPRTKNLMRRASDMALARPARRPLQVEYFNAESAKVWG
jgi:hypothetical protein